MTRTYATMEIAPAAYDEIKAKLEDAGYHQAIHENAGGEVLDMHGIGLVVDAACRWGDQPWPHPWPIPPRRLREIITGITECAMPGETGKILGLITELLNERGRANALLAEVARKGEEAVAELKRVGCWAPDSDTLSTINAVRRWVGKQEF